MKSVEFIDLLRWEVSHLSPGRRTLCGPMRAVSAPKLGLAAAACVFLGAVGLAAQGQQVFKGTICSVPGEREVIVKKGQSAAPCTDVRAKRGAKYMLADLENKTVYQLEGHQKPKTLAGNDVVVVGTLDKSTGTIDVGDMFRALPRKVTQAKTAYIDCDACPRGMASAWLAAFQELADWGRFDVVPDARKADLIFIFSANPYLGDYVTRDGPDKRPVSVDITYMDVVDPRTGESFWDDSRQWGALFVSRATKDLIQEFKEELQLEDIAGKT